MPRLWAVLEALKIFFFLRPIDKYCLAIYQPDC